MSYCPVYDHSNTEEQSEDVSVTLFCVFLFYMSYMFGKLCFVLVPFSCCCFFFILSLYFTATFCLNAYDYKTLRKIFEDAR